MSPTTARATSARTSTTAARDATVFLNGKWLSHPTTGTERYANEILRLWAEEDRTDLVLVLPADATVPEWASSVRQVRSRARGVLFEQIVLPARTVGRSLVSLAGPAPALKRRQLVVIHDASVFVIPSTYSRRFVLAYRLLYRTVARSADRVVTVSRFSAEELARFLRVPAGGLPVVPGSWEHMARARPAAPVLALPPQPFALFLGTPAAHKNLHPTLAAFDAAGVDCLVVGPRARAGVFGAAEGGAGAHIRMTGRLSDDELAWLLRRAGALVFPSLYEGFGLPVLEAQSQGCPVIASSAAAIPEIGGEGARYYDPARPEDAVAAFAELQDGEARRRLVQAGARNLERFSWTDSAASLATLAELRAPARR